MKHVAGEFAGILMLAVVMFFLLGILCGAIY